MADTAARLALIARRNEIARFNFVVTGIDLTGVDMKLVVRLDRGVPGGPLIQLGTVNSLAEEGLKLQSVTTVGGVPVSTIAARINALTMTDPAKVPYTGELGSDAVLQYAMVWTIGGDTRTRVLGEFIVQDSAYGSDNAPANRPAGYSAALRAGGASSGSLQFGDQVVHVTLDDADLLGAIADRAAVAAARAEAAAALIPTVYPGTFTAQRLGIDCNGQSLGAGPITNIGLTNSPYLNSIGFPARSVSPTAFVPLDVPHTQAHFPGPNDNRGESPLYGAARHFLQLVASRTLPTALSAALQLVGTNNAVDGQALDYFIQGTPNYAAKMSQIQAAWDLSQGPDVPLADRRIYEFLATFHTQGEAGSSGNYRDMLLQYARDLNTDAKAITKQLLDAILICYQTPTNQTSALGQYQAAQLSSLIVQATPIYQLWFDDALHLDANSEQILGAYYGLVLWWTQILRRKWHTCSPTGRVTRVSDRIYDVEYHAAGRLVFDTVNMPPQANNGFYLIGTGDQVLPSTAALREGATNVVRVTAVDPIPANTLHQYGRTTIVGKPNVQGFGGNMRDCLGDIFTFDVMDDLGNIRIADHPLHRWSPLHSIAIPPLA